MTWRDDLLPAQLNGLEFHYREVTGEGGRRTVLFQYPGSDDSYLEDLGKEARTYNIQAFLIGDNYHVTRDDLIDILDAGGGMLFQHPYHGEVKVKLLGKFKWTEVDTEGGTVRFDFTLVETGSGFPSTFVATPAKVAKLAATAATKVAEKTKFSLLGAISDVVQSVTNGIGKANSALRKANGKIGAALSLVDDVTFAIQDFDSQLTALRNQPQNLMNKFLALKSSVMGLVRDFEPPVIEVDVEGFPISVAPITLEAVALLNATEQLPDAIPTPTEQYAIEAAALAAVDLADKAGTVIYAAEALAAQQMENAAQAKLVQDTLVESFDNVLATEDLDPEILESMLALKAATIEHFTQQQQQLPDLATYQVQQTMPALVIAHELYGDATRVAEVIARNRIRHPAFVPGGTTLEVLADD